MTLIHQTSLLSKCASSRVEKDFTAYDEVNPRDDRRESSNYTIAHLEADQMRRDGT